MNDLYSIWISYGKFESILDFKYGQTSQIPYGIDTDVIKLRGSGIKITYIKPDTKTPFLIFQNIQSVLECETFLSTTKYLQDKNGYMSKAYKRIENSCIRVDIEMQVNFYSIYRVMD